MQELSRLVRDNASAGGAATAGALSEVTDFQKGSFERLVNIESGINKLNGTSTKIQGNTE